MHIMEEGKDYVTLHLSTEEASLLATDLLAKSAHSGDKAVELAQLLSGAGFQAAPPAPPEYEHANPDISFSRAED